MQFLQLKSSAVDRFHHETNKIAVLGASHLSSGGSGVVIGAGYILIRDPNFNDPSRTPPPVSPDFFSDPQDSCQISLTPPLLAARDVTVFSKISSSSGVNLNLVLFQVIFDIPLNSRVRK